MKTEEKKSEKSDTELIKPGASVVEFVPFGMKDKVQITVEIVKRMIAVKTKSGRTCSDQDAFKFMLMCQARKLNPFEGDAFLIGYDNRDHPDQPSFSLITAHQAFLKRAELHPEFDGMESGVIVDRNKEIVDLVGDWHLPTDTIVGGWAKVFFKNRSHAMHKRLRLSRFKKNYGIWLDDPAGMIVKCAEADALRSSFPTMLGGLYISEESHVIAEGVARPAFDEPRTIDNGDATVPRKTVAPETDRPGIPLQQQQTAKPEKKVPTALQRKSAARSTEKPVEKKPHETLSDMLALGKYTPDDFVSLAIHEGWIEPDQTWREITEARVIEFMKPENWSYIMEALDARQIALERSKNAPDAVHSERLL